MTKVSVVIPAYNRAKTICRCLNSVLNQSYRDIEIIVVDDCSQDETEEVLNDFIKQKDHSDVSLFYYKLPKNEGAPRARNYGFEKSNGDYVVFFDSDDEMVFDRIEKQVRSLQNGLYNCSVCGYTIVDDEGKRFDKIPVKEGEKLLLRHFWSGLFWSTQSWMYSRELIQKVGGYDERLVAFQDMDLTFSVVCTGDVKLGLVNESLTIFYDCNDENRIMMKWKTVAARRSLKIVFDKVIEKTIALRLWMDSTFLLKKEMALFFQMLVSENLWREWHGVSVSMLKNVAVCSSVLWRVYLVLFFCIQKSFFDIKFFKAVFLKWVKRLS